MDYEQIVETVSLALCDRTRVPFKTALGVAEARVAVEVIATIVAPDFRHIAQIVHQAFHGERGGTWRDCPVASCVRARDAITVLGVEP